MARDVSNGRGKPVVGPLDLSSAFSFPSREALSIAHAEKYTTVRYSRDTTQGAIHLERNLEAYFPGFHALVFNSGMSAVDGVFQWAWRNYDSMVVSSEIYRKSEKIIASLNQLSPKNLQRLEVREPVAAFVSDDPTAKFAFVEIPTNPHLRLVDSAELKSALPDGSFLAADLSLAGLDNIHPDQLASLDAIIVSLTKYVGGHNDLLGGVLLVRSELYGPFWEWRSQSGTILGPLEAFLAARSLKTFELRWAQHQRNADVILDFLNSRLEAGEISALYYPGAGTNHDQISLRDRVLRDRGSVFSFVVPGEREMLADRIALMEHIAMAPSFGSVDSLMEICSLMSQPEASDSELARLGLEPTLVRISVGLEDPELIIRDLEKIISPT